MSHNKKRNPAILFEVLVRTSAKSAAAGDQKTAKHCINLIKEHFAPERELNKEYGLYKSILEEENMEPDVADAFMKEIRRRYQKLDQNRLRTEKNKLISRVNREIGRATFDTFIPNYQHLATIYQMFNEKTPPKQTVLMEKKVISMISQKTPAPPPETKEPIDNLTFNVFVKKFNEKYGAEELLNEQKELLRKYVLGNGGIELKLYLNEEIGRIRKVLEQHNGDEVKPVLELLEGFKSDDECSLDKVVETVFKCQSLVEELRG